MFGRVQKKKLAKTKKPKVEEVLPPSILVTVTKKEEKKKKEEKRVVFDLPGDPPDLYLIMYNRYFTLFHDIPSVSNPSLQCFCDCQWLPDDADEDDYGCTNDDDDDLDS